MFAKYDTEYHSYILCSKLSWIIKNIIEFFIDLSKINKIKIILNLSSLIAQPQRLNQSMMKDSRLFLFLYHFEIKKKKKERSQHGFDRRPS